MRTQGGKVYILPAGDFLLLLLFGDIPREAAMEALNRNGIPTDGHCAFYEGRKYYILTENASPSAYFFRDSDGQIYLPPALVPHFLRCLARRVEREYYFNFAVSRILSLCHSAMYGMLFLAVAGVLFNTLLLHIALATTIVLFVLIEILSRKVAKIPATSLSGKGEEREFPDAIFSRNDRITLNDIMKSIEKFQQTGDSWWLKNGAWLAWAMSVSAGLETDMPPADGTNEQYLSYITQHMGESDKIPVFVSCPVCGTKIEMVPRALSLATGADGLFRYVADHGDHVIIVEFDRDLHVRNATIAHGKEDLEKMERVLRKIREMRRELGED